MGAHLFFICPTDHLEACISNAFGHDTYYYTSVGNSMIFDDDSVGQINELIKTKGIRQITFVLANDNPVIKEALQENSFLPIKGLSDFFMQIYYQKVASQLIWEICDTQTVVLSNHLINKTEEFKKHLPYKDTYKLKIDGKVYFREKKSFDDIQPDLVHKEHFNMN